MNNKFKGLYNTEKTTFITDKTEPINYYEPAIKTPRIQNHTYSINFDKTELYKEIEKLQQELQRKDNNWNELKEYIGSFLYMLNGILDRDIYEQCQLDDFTQIMDKINELEGENK